MVGQGADPLLPTDFAIVEAIRRGAPDAEIAARLGLSIGELKLRIARLQDRYGVVGRSALAAIDLDIDPAIPPVGDLDEPSTPDSDFPQRLPPAAVPRSQEGPPVDAQASAPVHSRRAMLGGLLAGGATLVGVGGYYLSRGTTAAEPAARPGLFATPTAPAQRPTPASSPPPRRARDAVQEAPGTWSRTALANGAALALGHGAGFVDTTTGDCEVFHLGAALPGERPPYTYAVSPANDVIVARSQVGESRYAWSYRRSTGASHSWNGARVDLSYFDDDVVIFAEMNPAGFRNTAPNPSGHYHVFGQDMQLHSAFELEDARTVGASFARVGPHHALATTLQTLHLIDLESGHVQAIQLPHVDGVPLVPFPLDDFGVREVPGVPTAFRVLAYRSPVAGASATRPPAVEVTLDPGGEVHDIGPPVDYLGVGAPAALESPDGQFRLLSGSLRSGDGQGALDYEDWAFAELREMGTDRPRFRVLSGVLSYGRSISRRWLADSSGFLVVAQGPGGPDGSYEAWRQRRTNVLVGIDGTMEELVPPGVDSPASLEPSPAEPGVFALNGARVWDRVSGVVRGPSDAPPTSRIDPWGMRADEIRLTFPAAGREPRVPGTLLPPVVETPPFRESVRLRVSGLECVPLHAEPAIESAMGACLPAGERVTVVAPPRTPLVGTRPGGVETTAFYGSQEHMFVHVRSETGEPGWVEVQYLSWPGAMP